MDERSLRDEDEAENEAENEDEAAELELEIARVCGLLNAATGRLVRLISQTLKTGSWQGAGIRSASQ